MPNQTFAKNVWEKKKQNTEKNSEGKREKEEKGKKEKGKRERKRNKKMKKVNAYMSMEEKRKEIPN